MWPKSHLDVGALGSGGVRSECTDFMSISVFNLFVFLMAKTGGCWEFPWAQLRAPSAPCFTAAECLNDLGRRVLMPACYFLPPVAAVETSLYHLSYFWLGGCSISYVDDLMPLFACYCCCCCCLRALISIDWLRGVWFASSFACVRLNIFLLFLPLAPAFRLTSTETSLLCQGLCCCCCCCCCCCVCLLLFSSRFPKSCACEVASCGTVRYGTTL